MKFFITYLSLFLIHFCFSQETVSSKTSLISTELINSFFLDADTFIGVDDFENYYYIKNNTLYKKTSQQIYTYTNTQLGEITLVDLTNPLKILLFYRDFNTFLFLDNRLNELIAPFNFNTSSFSKNITFVGTSSNNNLWIYSLDDNVLQLWNHQTQKIQFTSQPLPLYSDNFNASQFISSYKNCWLVGEKQLLKFNEYGTLTESLHIENNSLLKPFQKGYIYIKDAMLYYQSETTGSQQIRTKTNIIVKNYSMNNHHISIFDGTKIFVFKIIKNK